MASQVSVAAENTVLTDQGAFEFSAVDIDGDGQIGWNELSHPYGDQLSNAGWDQQQVFNRFDQDNDRQLSEQEYQTFTSQLNEQLTGERLVGNAGEGMGASDAEGWLEFEEVEADGDGSLDWNEIDDAYGERISAAGWDESQVMNDYDRNSNSTIEPAEYVLLIGDLQMAQQPGEVADSDSQQNMQTSSADQTSQVGQQANASNNGTQDAAAPNNGTQDAAAPIASITVLTVEQAPS